MSEWRNVKLEDVTTLIGDGLHGTPKYDTDGEYYFINGNNLIKGKIEIKPDTKKVSEEEALKYQKPLNYKTILLSINGTIGNLAYYNSEKCMLGKSACFINASDEVDVNFLYYQCLNEEFQFYIEMVATGTTIPNVPLKGIRQFSFNLPPLKEQKAIAEVLSSLDDKIDLLHRQNKTLEELAQTLFRQWFIEEADDEWEVCKLEDIAVIQNGFAFSSKHYVEEKSEHLEVLKMGHIERGGGLKLNPKKDFVPREEKLEKYILEKNDIVMAMTDMKDNVVILGVPALIDKSDKYVLNQRVARIYLKSNDKLFNSYLLYIQLKDPDFISLLQTKANSGVQVNLSTASIRESEVVIPPMNLQRTKGQYIIDLYLKKEKNNLQIKTLEKMRDTLLPKLMSGEVRVKI